MERLTLQVNDEQMLEKRQKPAAGTTGIPAAIQSTTIGANTESPAPVMCAAHGTARA
ncbi:MAG: hypothetical protein HP495_12195 [Nitrospira sp.]|jgi:hypothetical protein|nr:hypothetical protein [Nitrospira sp.]